MALRKAGANWVDGDRFFDREAELRALTERVQDGTHTLLTAQRRMGKTSLARELLRRLSATGRFHTVFVDLEGARDAADAVTEMSGALASVRSVWARFKSGWSRRVQDVSARVEGVELHELKVKLRAEVDPGSWRIRGDELFSAVAASPLPLVMVVDELPILVSRMLRAGGDGVRPAGSSAVDEFLGWLRKIGQTHRGDVSFILSGSIGLEPILRQAGLSAHVNIFSPYELEAWPEETAVRCLNELARTYGLRVPDEVWRDACRRLRSCVPHHVQQFFSLLHERLGRMNRVEATADDGRRVYEEDLLGVSGQAHLEHYETRLRLVLREAEYRMALELLTEAASNDGRLSHDAVSAYLHLPAPAAGQRSVSVPDMLRLLQHDGYLTAGGREGYRFTSGLVEDWWRARHATYFVPIAERRKQR